MFGGLWKVLRAAPKVLAAVELAVVAVKALVEEVKGKKEPPTTLRDKPPPR